MKFTVKQDEFSKALDLCKTTADTKSENPFSKSVKLVADRENNSVSFFSTNLLVSCECELQGSVEKDGAAVLDTEKLRTATKAMPAGMLTLSTDLKKHNTRITGTGCERKFGLHGLNPDHFPEIPKLPDPDKAPVYRIEHSLLNTTIKRVRNSCALPVAGRMHLAGILFEFRENSFVAVAMDGMTFSRFEHKDDFGDYSGEFFVPAATFGPIRLIANSGDIAFSFTDTTLFVSSSQGRVSCKFPDGKFPDWRNMMRSSATKEHLACQFDVEQLSSIVKSLTSVSKGNVRVSLGEGALTVALPKEADSQGEDSLPVDAPKGKSFSFLLNSFSLLCILDGIGGGIGELMCFDDELQPMTVASDDGYIGILLPLRGD